MYIFYSNNFLNKWHKNIIYQDLALKLNSKNAYNFINFNKITINISNKMIISTPTLLLYTNLILRVLTTQQSKICFAKKSIFNFKLRKGYPVGTYVTLRRDNLYKFLNYLIFIIFPNILVTETKFYLKTDNFGYLNFTLKDVFLFPLLTFHANIFPYQFCLNVTLSLKSNNLLNTKISKLFYSSFQLLV